MCSFSIKTIKSIPFEGKYPAICDIFFVFWKRVPKVYIWKTDFVLELKPVGSYLYQIWKKKVCSCQASGPRYVIVHGWKKNMWWPYVIITPQPSGTGVSLLSLAKPCLTTFPNSLQQLINSSQLLQLILFADGRW